MSLSKYAYHVILVTIVSIVVLVINIMAFSTKYETNFLFIFDLAYVIGNGAHFVALSLSSDGMTIKNEKS